MSRDQEWCFPNRATPLGSPAYYAVRFSPSAQRHRNAALLAWFELIDDIADHPRDPGVARLKLDWWRKEIAVLANGGPRHPLGATLATQGVGQPAIPYLLRIIDAAEANILTTPRDDSAFVDACRAGRGNLFASLGALDDITDNETTCLDAGGFCSAVEQVRHVANGTSQLPADCQADALRQLPQAQRASRLDTLFDAFGDVHHDLPTLPDLARRLSVLTMAIHDKMRRGGYPVLDTLIDRPPIAHLWTAWRCK